ncbi:MAG: hypothetical protein ACJA08_000346 [Cyclobacteriaceae bacterium]|jgi:hypothetical protein
MRKTLLILASGIAIAAIASVSPLAWKMTTLDLGEVKANEVTDINFEFTNTANNEVSILEAKGSCGCTQVEYPKEALAPGETAQIAAKFKSSKPGVFSKTISIKTNVAENYTVLTFKGTVVE